MKVTQLVMGYVATNTYILSEGDDCVVIDPCLDPQNNSRRIEQALKGKNVLGILLTHGHFDHISAVDVLVDKYQCPVYIIEEGQHWLSNPLKNLSTQVPEEVSIKAPSIAIKEGKLSVGPFQFVVRTNPGHTNHDTSYIIDDMAFVGDFIMKQTIGRTDLPSGNMVNMHRSIQKFIQEYDSLYLYPGHGEITTLEDEIKSNPFIKSKTKS